MYSEVLPYALAGILAVVGLYLIVSLASRGSKRARARWTWWEVLVYLGVLGSVTVLAATSFIEVLRVGTLHGWMLFLHMCGAGAFVAVLPLVAITWCEPSRFCLTGTGLSVTDRGPAPRFFGVSKLMFWMLLVSGFVVTMTMILSMLPLFGTDGLETLLAVHRYAGLVAVAAVALHLATVLMQRVKLA
jgi:hypothetical protein